MVFVQDYILNDKERLESIDEFMEIGKIIITTK